MTRQPNAASAAVGTRVKVPREEDPRNPNHRLAAFLDEGSLELITEDDDSGMLAATGTVGGQPVVVFASDATIMGGAMGVAGCTVVVAAYERALADGVPVLGLWHSGGARLPEGVVSLHAVGEVFAIMTRASGKIPQISVVIGAAAGGAAYGPALTDIVILAPEGRIFVTGPDVVRSVTGEDVDALRLGGPEPHGRRSGVVHVLAESIDDAFGRAGTLCRLLGDQGDFDLAAVTDVDLAQQLPESAKRAYDVHPPRRAAARRGRGPGAARPVGAQHRDDARSHGRAHSGRHRQQPDAAGRLPRLLVRGEGRPLRADVRCLRCPARRPRRRPRLPPRGRPGVGRRRAAGSQAAARLRRGGRAAGHRRHPQDLRRGLHRDELPLPGRHQGLRLARRPRGRHGLGRRDPHPAPPPPGRGRRVGTGRGRATARRRARPPLRRSAASRGDRRRRRDRRADPHAVGGRDGPGRGACSPWGARQHPALTSATHAAPA
ncbi:propionyl-CoA carboxylase [Janibacter hoylei PVAS-1]|uniref:Propionyl-CoA carboxylase n=1 Tax=Janibacter hoylei PVAS-1 TaxID=1210046 RepID=K1DZF9_9MICO|nr:propionyl-CoA carboxylase [Janibacter hoylei PVAS-1]